MHKGKLKMTTLDEYIDAQLNDPEFAQAWADSEDEYNFRLALIDARQNCGMTQADLARKTGMKQNAISRIETGDTNPHPWNSSSPCSGNGQAPQSRIRLIALATCQALRLCVRANRANHPENLNEIRPISEQRRSDFGAR